MCIALHGKSRAINQNPQAEKEFWGTKHVVLMQRRDSNDDDRNGAVKKPRVVWSVEMHQQFVNAVNQLGVDSKLACPSTFFELKPLFLPSRLVIAFRAEAAFGLLKFLVSTRHVPNCTSS